MVVFVPIMSRRHAAIQ